MHTSLREEPTAQYKGTEGDGVGVPAQGVFGHLKRRQERR